MPPIDPVHESFNVWIHYGFTGLFVFLSLLVTVYQTYQLTRSQNRYMVLLETVTVALANSANAQKHSAFVMDESKTSLESNTSQVRELLVYLKAKDEAKSEIRRNDNPRR